MARGAATAVITVLLVGIGLLLGRRVKKHERSRIWPALIVTGAGVEALALGYLWLFQRAGCRITSVGCMLNKNQGVLTVFAIVLAGVAVWAGIWSDLIRRRDAAAARSRMVWAAASSAMVDISHNLVHLAMVTVPDGAIAAHPQLRECFATVVRPDVRTALPRELQALFDTADRNESLLRGQPFGRVDTAPDSDIQRIYRAYIKNAVHLLMYGTIEYPRRTGSFLGDPGHAEMGRLTELVTALRQRDPGRDWEHSYVYAHRSSEVSDSAELLAAGAIPLICWVQDEVLAQVPTFPFAALLRRREG
jgi:hypothetical protein